jgi:hypothetical protein
VSEFHNWSVLGVHRPITHLATGEDLTARVDAGELPTYVVRARDRSELRPALAAMADGTVSSVRLVLITGQSAAGKTRAAMEAMRVELATWRLLILHGPSTLAQALNDDLDLSHTVVWLDEIQELVAQPNGAEQLRRLLALPTGPTVLLATLRTDVENTLRGLEGWRLLNRRACRITLPRRFDSDELANAYQLDDPWITDALTGIGDRYGIAEWLAAGPQLLRKLQRATNSSDPIQQTAAAIVNAAIDCYRAGYVVPIPDSLLRDMHQIYIANADSLAMPGLFDTVLAWARTPVAGATGLLERHGSHGDMAFDYLLGHANNSSADIPTRLWQVLLRHVTLHTLEPIGHSAILHGRKSITRTLADRDSSASLYAALGDADRLRLLAADDEHAAWQLAELMSERGDVAELTRLANVNDDAQRYLAKLLAERGDIRQLMYRVDRGDRHAAEHVATWLAEQGDIEGLRRRADNGDFYGAWTLARVLAEQGEIGELTHRANNDSPGAAFQLADLLAEHGAIEELIRRADTGEREAGERLARLLTEQSDIEQLTDRAENGDWRAARALATLRLRQRDMSELLRLTDNGNREAEIALASLLKTLNDVETLTVRANEGSWSAQVYLASLLNERGDVDELSRRADRGDRAAAQDLNELLADRGDISRLTVRADSGDWHADENLADLLVVRGDLEGLTWRADNGSESEVKRLVSFLAAEAISMS